DDRARRQGRRIRLGESRRRDQPLRARRAYRRESRVRNVEMTKLTPYSATFAGRRIASGKLSLDLEYRIEDQQLQGDNRIVMDQLTLGEKLESEDAPNLPLDLAVAILKDSEGRIDLGLPVSGSLEDPEFSFGGLIGKALLGLVTKIVTAPFRALRSEEHTSELQSRENLV